jgi:hypothetical protein
MWGMRIIGVSHDKVCITVQPLKIIYTYGIGFVCTSVGDLRTT